VGPGRVAGLSFEHGQPLGNWKRLADDGVDTLDSPGTAGAAGEDYKKWSHRPFIITNRHYDSNSSGD
jgi:hypothetical protein